MSIYIHFLWVFAVDQLSNYIVACKQLQIPLLITNKSLFINNKSFSKQNKQNDHPYTHTHTHIPISTYMYMRIPTATHSLRMLNRCDFNLIFFSNLILMVIIFQLKISLHIYVFVCLYVTILYMVIILRNFNTTKLIKIINYERLLV